MGVYYLLLSFLMGYFIPFVLAKDINEHSTKFLGEELQLFCRSPYAPIWNWFGKNKVVNLAVGGTKHKKFQNDRYIHQHRSVQVFTFQSPSVSVS